MQFHFSQLTPLLTCISTTFVTGYLWSRRRSSPAARAFLLFNAAVFACCLVETFLRLPSSDAFFEVTSHLIGPLFFPLALLYLRFVTAFTGQRHAGLYIFCLLLSVSGTAYGAVHPMVYREVVGPTSRPLLRPDDAFPYVFAVSVLPSAILASSMCVSFIHRNRRHLESTQLLLVFSGIIFSVVLAIAAISVGPLIGLGNSLSSVALFSASFYTYFAIRRYSFLSVNIEYVERAFDGLFEALNDVVMLLDSAGRPTRVNASARVLFHTASLPLTAEGLRELIDDYAFEKTFVEEAVHIQTGSVHRYFLMSQSLVVQEDISLGKLLILRDITKQRSAEEELFKIRSMESIGQLAAGIAHDFNNYLCGMLSCFSFARLNLDPCSDQYKVLEEGERAATQAKSLTQQLLTFSRGGAVRKETFDIVKTVRVTTQFCLRGAATAAEFDTPRDPVYVSGDPTQINQVVQNLVINATQAMNGKGRIAVSIARIRLGRKDLHGVDPGEYVQLRVTDSGPGIKHSIKGKIFDPYFTTKEGGNGLGLAVVFSVLRRHGGTVTVDTTPGRGATFFVYLPAAEKPCDSIPEHPGKLERPASGRILIMDDNDVVRSMLVRLVEKFGYTVDAARNGDEAIHIFDTARERGLTYAAVITDLTVVGGMGGKELAQRLHAVAPSLPIVISSGYSEEVSIVRYKEFGFAEVLHKPYDARRLREVLEAVTEVHLE